MHTIKKRGLIQSLRRFFIPLYRTFVLSAVFLLGLLRGGISLDAPADRFGVSWIPSVNEISKPYFDFAGFFGLHFRSKKSPENQGFFQLVALGIMIDTRCILALAGALYSLFVISNLYILSRFSDAILMYFPIFFINSSHPINEQ